MWKKNVMSPQVAQLLNKDLIQVVANPAGTAHAAQISGVTLAGKTGTAEFKKSQKATGRENGWFVAYDAGKKNLLVTMMVENTQKSGGSHVVTPKVKAVFHKVQSR
jgi:penicillin-binding protein